MKEPINSLSYPARYKIEKYNEMYRHCRGIIAVPLWQWMITNGPTEFQRLFYDREIVKVE